MSFKEKRPRTKNFTDSDRQLLLELVSNRRSILECKKTDVISNKKKESEWNRIAEEFNVSSGQIRSVQSLRTLWDNIKRTYRKVYSDNKVETFKTGGGRKSETGYDDTAQIVHNILNASLDGLHNPYDNDAAYNEGYDRVVLAEDASEEGAATPTSVWSEWDSQQLRQPVSVELAQSTSTSTTFPPPASLPEATPITSEDKPVARRRRVKRLFTTQDEFWVEKKKYVELAITLANNEEARKQELHGLEIESKKLKIELLKLQIKEKLNE